MLQIQPPVQYPGCEVGGYTCILMEIRLVFSIFILTFFAEATEIIIIS